MVNLAAALAAQDFIEYDEAYTAPLAGFRDAEDYYTKSSCGRLLQNIRCPTLVVHAVDDPLMTANILPDVEALSPCVTLEVAQKGGHVGFVSANAHGRPYCWLERRLSAYLHSGFERQAGIAQDQNQRVRAGRALEAVQRPPDAARTPLAIVGHQLR